MLIKLLFEINGTYYNLVGQYSGRRKKLRLREGEQKLIEKEEFMGGWFFAMVVNSRRGKHC